MKFINDVIECFANPKYLSAMLEGLKLTFIISLGAAIVGLLLGMLVALVKISKSTSPWMILPRTICNIYITVIRGTPMALQLFIMAFIIFAIRGFPQEITAIIAFGINSGAYVAESIRAGILSVDVGQTEAGRALGLSNGVTMMKIVIPQAVKNILPTMGNEFITLIKETSVVSFIGATDLYKTFNDMGSNTYEFMVPYLVMGMIYIVLVSVIALGIKLMERRLARSDRNH
jgi:polar amino acid transport system permease protein